jgi:sec-independent protein translocase protein TatA
VGALKPWHILILVAVLVLLFGAKRLPGAARSIGQSMRILKTETHELMDDGKSPKTPNSRKVIEDVSVNQRSAG